MSGRVQFPIGLDLLMQAWTTDPFEWALLDPTWVPDESTEVYIGDVTAYELTDGSYARDVATTKTRVPTAPASPGGEGTIVFGCDNPEWVAIAGAEAVGWAVLFGQVTNDADSPLVLAQPISYTTSGATLTLTLSVYGVWQVSTVCPAQF